MHSNFFSDTIWFVNERLIASPFNQHINICKANITFSLLRMEKTWPAKPQVDLFQIKMKLTTSKSICETSHNKGSIQVEKFILKEASRVKGRESQPSRVDLFKSNRLQENPIEPWVDIVNLEIVDGQFRNKKHSMVEIKYLEASWVGQQWRVYLKGIIWLLIVKENVLGGNFNNTRCIKMPKAILEM